MCWTKWVRFSANEIIELDPFMEHCLHKRREYQHLLRNHEGKDKDHLVIKIPMQWWRWNPKRKKKPWIQVRVPVRIDTVELSGKITNFINFDSRFPRDIFCQKLLHFYIDLLHFFHYGTNYWLFVVETKIKKLIQKRNTKKKPSTSALLQKRATQTSSSAEFLTFDPRDIAQQMTLLDAIFLQGILSSELVKQVGKYNRPQRRTRDKNSVQLLNHIEWFSQVRTHTTSSSIIPIRRNNESFSSFWWAKASLWLNKNYWMIHYCVHWF